MPPNPNNQSPGKGEREVDGIGKTEEAVEENRGTEKKKSVCSLVDELLSDIYGKAELKRKQSVTTAGEWSWQESDQRNRGIPRFRSNLKQIEAKCWSKDIETLREQVTALEGLIAEESNNLVKYLKRKDYLLARREAHYDVITAVIHAISRKTRDDMKMKFSLTPGNETGFSQWLDAMKMVAQLPGGVPSEFRTKLWLQLSERHLTEQNIDWEKAEAIIFNEWTNPDDEELGVQIVKDLHRTGCSLFCGAQEQNQALLKRVLLAYARWNKNVGYCQGFNMLAALILQVMDRDEKHAVKVMIYLIEGVLPESYFANNLRGLSVDMAVFRDLLRLRLPKLSKHLEALQNDTNSGTSYEPPLTNVFTMQWFLTLFSNCLPQQTVLRVWDLVFLHGNEVLLRTALAIWGILQDRIMSVESADEFYSIMGVVTREMLEFGLMDANNLIKMIVMVDPFPNELQELREKYLYNISPWTQSVQSAARKGIKLFYSDPEDQDDTEDEDKIALATAYGVFRRRESGSRDVQPMGPTLDISVLKQQYAKLRQRQRQAHIIISAACSSSIPANLSSVPTVSVNHLLMGKSALVNKGRRIGPPEGSIPPPKNRTVKGTDVGKQSAKKEKVIISGETLDWKDAEKRKCSTTGSKTFSNTDRKVANNKLNTKTAGSCNGLNREGGGHYGEEEDVEEEGHRRMSTSSASSTSTELCDDEFHRLSDFDSEEGNPSRGSESATPSDFPDSARIIRSPTDTSNTERYKEVRECAEDLVRDIEKAVNRSERLSHMKNPAASDNYRKVDSDSLSTSNHDNIILKSPGSGDVKKEFLKPEPEVPIAGNVIDNAENRIFDRSKREQGDEEEEEAARKELKIRKERDRRKSDLALSVIKENLEMLSKFSQKSAVREEWGEETVNGYQKEDSIGKKEKDRIDKGGEESVLNMRLREGIERGECQVTEEAKRDVQVLKVLEEEAVEEKARSDRQKIEEIYVKREEDQSRSKTTGVKVEEDRLRSEKTLVKQEEDRQKGVTDEFKLEEGRSRSETIGVKRAEDQQKRVTADFKQEGDRSKRDTPLVTCEEDRQTGVTDEFKLEEGRSKSETIGVKLEEDRQKRVTSDFKRKGDRSKRDTSLVTCEEDRQKGVTDEFKREESPLKKETTGTKPETDRPGIEGTEVKREEEGVVNGKTDSFGDHFRKEERSDSPQQKTISRVNKEVNTDITIATGLDVTPSRTAVEDHDEFLKSLISSKKSPERFKSDKLTTEPRSVRPFSREDLAERWKKESERIESKIELSKSDWDLKMKRIAELENTTREKLNEIKSKSIVHRHRSLDRFEGRDREKRKSPIPRIHVPEDEADNLEWRKKKISALSFDEITSRTEKLLGANLGLDSGHRKWRKFDEDGEPGKTYEYYSSPTSPENRARKRAEYSSPKRYEARWKHAQPTEEDWLTITEENGRGTGIEMVSPGRRLEKDQSPAEGFNPFPTRTYSRPKELGVRLGMYPPSPDGGHSSRKSQ